MSSLFFDMTQRMQQKDVPFKSGFIAIMGAPNVGKSTLLNRILGQKIAITSNKPQTTRHRILGIAHLPQAQIIFLDTPGIHQGRKALNRRMVDIAMAALADVDLVVFMTDATREARESDAFIIAALKENNLPTILAMNKVDMTKKEKLLPHMERWQRIYPFQTIVPISALLGTQVDRLLAEMITALPEGPPYYPEDTITDMPERVVAAEMIREKVFRLTGEEIPYAAAVTIESFKERPGKNLVDIHATIHVEKNSQKPIVIGKGGKMLRRIGEAARMDIERMVGCKVFLKLWVRIQKNWTKDEKAIQKLGY